MYLAAFVSKFTTTCSNRAASASNQIACFGSETVSSCLRWSISDRTVATALFHDDAQGDRLEIELNPARGNARDFEQIINDPSQLPHLTLDNAGGLLEYRVLDSLLAAPVAVQAEQKSRIQDRGKGLRSSWLSIARNSSLRRSRSANAAACSSVSRCKRLRSVMSRMLH